MIGIQIASASATVASRLRPCSIPSRAMSVYTIAETPTSSKRRAMSSTESSRGFRPTLDRNFAIARIQPHRNPPWIIARSLFDERRVAHGSGADDNAVNAFLEPAFHGRGIAHAASELHRNADGFENAINSGRIHRHCRQRRRRDQRYADTRSLAARKPAPAPPDRGGILSRAPCRPCSSRTARPSLRSMAGKRITATTSENLRSKQAPGVGSSPGGTGCRPCCRERRWP